MTVDIVLNSLQIVAQEDGIATVKCANVTSTDECSDVDTEGTLVAGETFTIAYAEENKVEHPLIARTENSSFTRRRKSGRSCCTQNCEIQQFLVAVGYFCHRSCWPSGSDFFEEIYKKKCKKESKRGIKMIKRIITILIVTAMLFTMTPVFSIYANATTNSIHSESIDTTSIDEFSNFIRNDGHEPYYNVGGFEIYEIEYAYHDITGDGVPELIVSAQNEIAWYDVMFFTCSAGNVVEHLGGVYSYRPICYDRANNAVLYRPFGPGEDIYTGVRFTSPGTDETVDDFDLANSENCTWYTKGEILSYFDEVLISTTKFSSRSEAFVAMVNRTKKASSQVTDKWCPALGSHGFLEDLDDDGDNELILYYAKEHDREALMYYWVVCVYDYNDQMIEMKLMEAVYTEPTNEYGDVGIVTYDGVPMLAVYRETYNHGSNDGPLYNWWFYAGDNDTAPAHEIELRKESLGGQFVDFSVDGETVDKATFLDKLQHIDGLEYVNNKGKESLEFTCETATFDELIQIMEDVDTSGNGDGIKRLTQINVTQTNGSTRNTQFFYNERGLITATLSEGLETLYTYDSSDRLTSVQINSDLWNMVGPNAEYFYDDNGFLIRSSQAEGSRVTQNYENDSSGRCIRSYYSAEGVSCTSEYSYNEDATRKDEVLTRTDYEGTVTTDYISYYYDKDGNITNEVCDGAYWSYTRQYLYTHKPFVVVSEDNKEALRMYIPDVMGNPIWEVAYIEVTTIENDADGYLSSIIVESGATYDFVYEVIPNISNSNSEENHHFELYSPNQELSVEKGKYIQILCKLYSGDQLVEDLEQPGISIGNSDLVSYVGCEQVDGGYCLTLKGVEEGTSTFTLFDSNTETSIEFLVDITAPASTAYSFLLNQVPCGYPDSFWDREVKTNFYNFNGLYVTGLEKPVEPVNGEYNLKFNVYNTRYMHGSVDIYNREDEWIQSVRIDKNANVQGVWDVMESGFFVLCDFVEWNGSFTSSLSSTETVVDIYVPEGGYFVITNNFYQSPAVYLYNGIDYAIYAANKTLDFTLDGEAIKDVQNKTIQQVIQDPRFRENFENTVVKNASKMAATASGNVLTADLTQSAGKIANEMIKLLENIDINFWDLTASVTDIAVDVFTSFLPPQVSQALNFMFTTSEVTDLLGQLDNIAKSYGKPYIRIYTPEACGELTVEGVKATPVADSLPENAVLQVFKCANNETLTIPNLELETDEYKLYDISYASNGEEIQPDGKVTIHIPVPEGYGWSEYAVLHQQTDGTWEIVHSETKDGQIVFAVDHFSLFAVVDGHLVSTSNNTIVALIGIVVVTGIVVFAMMKKKKPNA